MVRRAGTLTFPKARSTESKYRSIPRRMKKAPKPVMPTPISATGKEAVVGGALGVSPVVTGQVPSGELCAPGGVMGWERKNEHRSTLSSWKRLCSPSLLGTLSSKQPSACLQHPRCPSHTQQKGPLATHGHQPQRVQKPPAVLPASQEAGPPVPFLP